MNIAAVIVTFNRLECLKKTLNLYTKQELKPAKYIIINNCSTDGTKEYLDEWKKEDPERRIIRHMERNTGGSGGFYEGMKIALLQDECEWVWVADDDAYPRVDTFKKLDEFNQEEAVAKQASVLCSAIKANNEWSPVQRGRMKKFLGTPMEKEIPIEEFQKKYFEIDIYTFVGALMRKSALAKAGPARKDFFIYYDDNEHSFRMAKEGKLICVTDSIVDHDSVGSFQPRNVTWRNYYITRNVLTTYKEEFGTRAFFMRACFRTLVAFSSLRWQNIKQCFIAIHDAIYRPGWPENTGK